MAKEDVERLLHLMNKKEFSAKLSLKESIELRRLAAEYVDDCAELVSKKMNEFYLP